MSCRLPGLTVKSKRRFWFRTKAFCSPIRDWDLIVGGRIVLELKSVEQLLPIHEAKLLSYQKPPDYDSVC
jgi:hypothetical protein